MYPAYPTNKIKEKSFTIIAVKLDELSATQICL